MDLTNVTMTCFLTDDVTMAGESIANIKVAVNGFKDKVDYYDVVAFKELAKACVDNIGKGSQIAIVGRLQQDRWKDKDTGKSRSRVKIIANQIQFLSYKKKDDVTTPEPVAENNSSPF